MKVPEIKQLVLGETTLCAIVRDEMVNPAGGIEDFIRSTVPYVAKAVVLDTGSVDGTYEKLLELAKVYGNLTVEQRQFTNYAEMRNLTLDKVETDMVLILDADERLTEWQFNKMHYIRNETKEGKEAIGFNLYIQWIFESEDKDRMGGGHNPRWFVLKPGMVFKSSDGGAWEYLYLGYEKVYLLDKCFNSGIYLNHFCVTREIEKVKDRDWYGSIVAKGKAVTTAPSKLRNFQKWKKLNPRRVGVVGLPEIALS